MLGMLPESECSAARKHPGIIGVLSVFISNDETMSDRQQGRETVVIAGATGQSGRQCGLLPGEKGTGGGWVTGRAGGV